jgi:hypothetical protein
MACCIIGALIMAYVMTLKSRIRRFLGLPVQSPDDWDSSAPDAGNTPAPVFHLRMLRAATLIGAAFVFGFLSEPHWEHISGWISGHDARAATQSASQYVCTRDSKPWIDL